MNIKDAVMAKLLCYVAIDTQSNDSTGTTPSTDKQFNLSNLLVEELHTMGVTNAFVDEHCYVYATIPATNSNARGIEDMICLLAHVDTSPDSPGNDVKPQVIDNYSGGDIVLPGDNEIVIRVNENKELVNCIGHTIITTDGTTLLGSDDKSGVAAIMTLAEILANDPSIKHNGVIICFTPDEEIGGGTAKIDMSKIRCAYAYTVDGDMPGELNKETFSADSATITIAGRDIHPGMAKDIMVNAARVMGDIIARLPKDMSPETTEGYQPFIHPTSATGNITEATIKFILRDFKTEGLTKQREILESIIADVQKMYPRAKIALETKVQYRNMFDELEKNPKGLDYLWKSSEQTGVKPYWKPIRGGTDGSRLTEMGLPCPNIYTGGQNFHSRTEWVSIDALTKTVETLVNLVKIWGE